MVWERKDTMIAVLIPLLMAVIAGVGLANMRGEKEEPNTPVEEEMSNDELARRGWVKLTFEEHAAAWISQDNAFTHEGGEKSKHRGGLVFQLGEYRDFRIPSKVVAYSSVEFEGTERTQKFERKKEGGFYWIDLVGADPEKAKDHPPVKSEHVGQLFPDQSTEVECLPVEKCSGKNCLGKALEKMPEQCLRLRRVDARWKPDALITYWQGIDGYNLESRHSGNHSTFTFTFRDPVTVTVYERGTNKILPLDIGTLTRIRINLEGGGDHGEVHDPGFGGGLTKTKG